MPRQWSVFRLTGQRSASVSSDLMLPCVTQSPMFSRPLRFCWQHLFAVNKLQVQLQLRRSVKTERFHIQILFHITETKSDFVFDVFERQEKRGWDAKRSGGDTIKMLDCHECVISAFVRLYTAHTLCTFNKCAPSKLEINCCRHQCELRRVLSQR